MNDTQGVEAGDGDPSPGLRELIVAAARTEPQQQRRLKESAAWAIAGLLMLLAVAWAVALDRSLEHVRAASHTNADAVAFLTSSATRRAPLHGADGLLGVDARGRAMLVVRALPRAAAGRTYEAWVIYATAAAPAGLFLGGSQLTVVRLTRAVPRGAVVAVSLERVRGARLPHRPLVFAATPNF